MAQLFSKLPEEVKAIIIGVQEPAEAWELLEERYGDAQIAVLLAIQKLQTVKLPDRPPHDKVEALVPAVRTGKACLRAAGAEQQIFADCFTLGKVVEKLAVSMQSDWFHYRTRSARGGRF